MRKTLLAITALWATGCTLSEVQPTETQATSTNPQRTEPFRLVDIDVWNQYVIDPRTESCFLHTRSGHFNFTMVHVSCAKLKKNVPEAAAFITWETTDAAAQ
ncbi:MAG TPA: hypothetical protein VEU33_25600 [Archangium sp.]|nr:hypothetical protein [Archangium sp.]